MFKVYYNDPRDGKRYFTRGQFIEWIGPLGFEPVLQAKIQVGTRKKFIQEDWFEPEAFKVLPARPTITGSYPFFSLIAPTEPSTAPQGVTVEALIALLNKAARPQELIILSRDEEGNKFSPLAKISIEQGCIILWPRD